MSNLNELFCAINTPNMITPFAARSMGNIIQLLKNAGIIEKATHLFKEVGTTIGFAVSALVKTNEYKLIEQVCQYTQLPKQVYRTEGLIDEMLMTYSYLLRIYLALETEKNINKKHNDIADLLCKAIKPIYEICCDAANNCKNSETDRIFFVPPTLNTDLNLFKFTKIKSQLNELYSKIGDLDDDKFDIENDSDGIFSEGDTAKILELILKINKLKEKEKELDELHSAAVTESTNSINNQFDIIKIALDELKYALGSGSHVVVSI